LPVPAYNTFNEIFDSLDADDYDSATPFKIELIKLDEFTIQSWPVQPGDYRVINATKSIALAVLQGIDMDEPDLATVYSKIAIIGSINTENLGVEHLIKNLIANPYLRYLVLWGEDIEGHLPGDALLNLIGSGLDKTRRIIGARGARPVLKNLTESEVHHLRRQIQVIDLIGRKDISELTNRLELLNKQAAQPYEAGLRVDLVEIQKAKSAKRLKLDPTGYFVIMVMKGKENPLLIEHYSNDGTLRNMIEGIDSASICATLIEKKLISQLDHAAYLGRELAKAELSLISDSRYTQDQAQGELT
jgi:tetrahydromethanopterin S-methyltransferase subunit A